jgi:hypothetical protein
MTRIQRVLVLTLMHQERILAMQNIRTFKMRGCQDDGMERATEKMEAIEAAMKILENYDETKPAEI